MLSEGSSGGVRTSRTDRRRRECRKRSVRGTVARDGVEESEEDMRTAYRSCTSFSTALVAFDRESRRCGVWRKQTVELDERRRRVSSEVVRSKLSKVPTGT